MVITFPAHAAVTPAGKPVGVPMPVAPFVPIVISVNTVSIHKVGVVLGAAAVLLVPVAVTVIVPVAFTVPHPPVNGML